MMLQSIPNNNDRTQKITLIVGIIHVKQLVFLCIVKIRVEMS